MTPSADLYLAWQRRLAICAAAVANYADRAEHNEPVDQRWILNGAEQLREIAFEVARAEEVDLLEAYAARLADIETKSAQHGEQAPGADGARRATTWRELQLVQADHDRIFHPDVVGLMKFQQLQHYSLHLIKITGALARRSEDGSVANEVLSRRLPDMLLFYLKLHTVINYRLAATALPGRDDGSIPRLAVV